MLCLPVNDGHENTRTILLILIGRSVGVVRTHLVDLADLRLVTHFQSTRTGRPGVRLTEIDRPGEARIIEIAGEHISRSENKAKDHTGLQTGRPRAPSHPDGRAA